MAKRKSLAQSPCPVARALDIVGDRWSMLIVRDAFDGIRRFGAFESSLGVARNILTDRLRSLVEQGILQLIPASDGTAYQEYVLTAKGEALFPVVVSLRQWGEVNLYAEGEPHSVLLERSTGQPLTTLVVTGEGGAEVKSSAAYVRK
jgi:DNA-binding HxlR family transcriptional regulator